jgi:hypothetical protein
MPPQIFIHGEMNEAEAFVLDRLRALPNEVIVYAQPHIISKGDERYPDFVIVYHLWGVVVLEVKDWLEVVDVADNDAYIRERSGKLVWRSSPVQQARQAAFALKDALEADPDLVDWRGRLDFSYAFGGILPHLRPAGMSRLVENWGPSHLLGPDALLPETITRRIADIPVPFRNLLTDRQVAAIRATIDPRNKRTDPATGALKGILNSTQEAIYKEPMVASAQPEPSPTLPTQAQLDIPESPSPEARFRYLEQGLPAEVAQLRTAQHVRLVRGFAGTGKTDLVILRAQWLHDQYPEFAILVTTFNRPLWEQRLLPELKSLRPKVYTVTFDTLCSDIFKKKHRMLSNPLPTLGLVAVMAAENPLVEKFGREFLADEFMWIKETGRARRDAYVKEARVGRGTVSGRILGRTIKNHLFDLFEEYQSRLREMTRYDWVDLHDKVLGYLQEGLAPDRRYDVILIDEAQHFAPTWMRIIDHFLKPGGLLFLCDDPSQGVYRYFSWRQKGVDVAGHTRWLRVPYRCTRQIFQAAWALIADNPLAKSLLSESGERVLPDLDNEGIRNGELPQAHSFASLEAECAFLETEVQALVQQGIYPREIGILHDRSHVLKQCSSLGLPRGVQIHELKKQTGLEYRAVFVPRLHELFDRRVGVPWQEDEARQLQQVYVAMTRARDRLCLLCAGDKWPRYTHRLRPYMNWVQH